MKHLITLILLNLFTIASYSQSNNVGIGTTTPNASAALDITANDKGILIPRLSTTEREMITSPAVGLLVFDTDTNTFWYHTTLWNEITTTGEDNLGNHMATQDIDMNSQSIINLQTPINASDAATKSYVDGELAPLQSDIAANASSIVTNSANVHNNAANIFNNTLAINTHTTDDTDLSPTNEIQTLSISGQDLSLSSGNTITLPDDVGVFELNSGVVRNTGSDDDDFIFGASELPSNGTNVSESLFLFDENKGALRSGVLTASSNWSPDSIGFFSTAFGLNSMAKGLSSFAEGKDSEARGDYSIAMGNLSIASGLNSIALGFLNEAYGYSSIVLGLDSEANTHGLAMGYKNNAKGEFSVSLGRETKADAYGSMAVGLYNIGGGNATSRIETDPLFEVGNGTDLSNKNNALTILKNGTVSFDHYTFPNADGTANQVMSTDGAGNVSWMSPEEGIFETNSNVIQYTGPNDHDFALGLDSLPVNGVPYSENGFLYDGGSSAIRSGTSFNSLSWTSNSIGPYSAGFGNSTVASGNSSVAMGGFTEASGIYSVAINAETQATALAATAMGRFTDATGQISLSAGLSTKAEAYASAAFGRYNVGTGNSSTWVSTDPLFEVGNGADHLNKSNALTILKNGTVSFENYTFPDVDGTANQVMSTDGSGNISWADPSSGVFENNAGIVRNSGANTDDFLFGSNQLPQNGSAHYGDLFFFDSSKGAFRAGNLNNSEAWAIDSLGSWSAAFGLNTIAKGSSSFASGYFSVASGFASTSMGINTEATGSYAVSMGYISRAQGYASFAAGNQNRAKADNSATLGFSTISESFASTSIGMFNIGGGSGVMSIATDPIFEIGNGDSETNRSNALTIYKNGVAEFTDSLHTAGNINIGNGIGSRIYLGNTMMQSGGPTMLRVDANIRPFEDDMYDLGSTGKRWDNVYATNGIIQTSDKRLKKNISSLNYGLEEVLKLQPVQYNWKKEQEDEKMHVGLIAQDLLQIIPEVVSEEGKYLGVKYAELVPVLIQAIKDQQKLISDQRVEISNLYNHNQATTSQIEYVMERISIIENSDNKISISE